MTRRHGDTATRGQSPCHLVAWSPFFGWFALSLILIVAALFRFYGLAWDSGYLFHPDERKILLVTYGLRLPANILEFFSSDSPLNPKFFAYGSFPIYLLKALGAFAPVTSYAVPWREDLVGLAVLGRALSALFDLGTIVLVFLLARRLYDATVGLIASACVAVTVLHIQLSHFYAVDTLLTLLIVATMFFAVRYAQMGTRHDKVLMGVAYGLALATKVTAAPLIVPIVVAAVKALSLRGAQFPGTARQGRCATKQSPSASGIASQSQAPLAGKAPAMTQVRNWLTEIRNTRGEIALIIGVALVAFVITQPYVLLDPIRYFGQVGTELLVARGWLDYPYTRQYADTLLFIYPIAQSSVWGMGLPLGIFAWGGSVLFVWRWWKKRDWRDGFVLSWALVYFLVTGAQYTKYLRYLLPLLPFLFLMAAVAVSRITHRAFRFALCGFISLALLSACVYSLVFVSIYSREHPWLQISRWIYQHVPAGSAVAIEHWDDALPVPMRGEGSERAPAEYRMQVLLMYYADDAKKLETIVDVLSDSGYIILATQRLSGTITRLPQRYPISSRYYRLLFDGQLGFDLVASAQNGITLDGVVIGDDRFDSTAPRGLSSDAFVWNWGRADESFTVYDHPLPLVFKKTRNLSRDELRALLSQPW